MRLPAGTLELLIEYRGYAAAFAAYRSNPKAEGALVQTVKAIDFALAQEQIDAQ